MTTVTVCSRAFFLITTAFCCTLLTNCSSPQTDYPSDANLDSLLISAIKKTNALNFEQALAELNQVVAIARKRGDEKNQILGTINLGVLYLKYNADDEALKYFLKALDLAETFHNEAFLNTIYNNIGIIYSANNAHDKAIEFYEKALQISRKQENKHRIAINLINLGTESQKKGNGEQALHYLRQSLAMFSANHDTLNASVALNNIGDVYYQHQQYDSALLKHKKARAIILKLQDKYYAPQYCLSLGKTYYQLHHYDSAALLLQNSLKGFQETKSTENIIESYAWLAKVNRITGNTDQALNYSTLSLAWKDTLLQEKTSTWISELQMKYEFGKKEKEIELLQAEAIRQKQLWIGSIITGTIMALLVFLTLRTKNINLQQRNVILQKEQEMSRLILEKNKAEREQLQKDIIATEKLNALEKQKLKQELTFKDRELATKALHLVNKNETFASIHKLLSAIDLKESPQEKALIEKVKKIIRGNENTDREWEAFKLHFEEVHPRFFSQLQEAYPTLSANDLRLSAYLLIDLSPKEIAHIFNISHESIRKKKQRLRQKLNLEKEEDIKTLLTRFRQSE